MEKNYWKNQSLNNEDQQQPWQQQVKTKSEDKQDSQTATPAGKEGDYSYS